MATSYPLPRRHATAIASYRIFYELAERSPILTPHDGEDPVVSSCIVAMRKETDRCRKQAEACPEEAIGYLNSALDIHCDRAPLYLQRGLAYWRNGDLEAMEVDMSTAIALDSSPSNAAAHFFRALGRVNCGHITGALDDLQSCVDKLGWKSHAGSCATQEHYAVERLLVRQRKYCDAAAVAKAAEACAAREARGAALAKEARAQGSLVRRQWLARIRMALEQRAPAAHQANIPEETTDISTTLRIKSQAKSCEDQSPVQSPRSVASWPASSAPSSPLGSPRQADVAPSTSPDSPRQADVAPSSPPDSPRQADVAPAQQCLTAGDARAEAALQQWEEYCAILCEQRKAAHALAAAAADMTLATGGAETNTQSQPLLSARTAAPSPSDSPIHAGAQPGPSPAPEQPTAAPAEHESAAEAEASPSPVCLCMHDNGATRSRHPCCSCGRYCKPSVGQHKNPDILAGLATTQKEAEVYLRRQKTNQPHKGKHCLRPSSQAHSAFSTTIAGANQDGCGAASVQQQRPATAADGRSAPAKAACKKKDKSKGRKRKGHCRRSLTSPAA